ncbi:RidA family protein [soil metagenome]
MIARESVPGQTAMMPGAIAANGTVWTSGIISPSVLIGTPASFTDQADQVLAELARTLEAIGSGLDRVVSLNVFLASANDFAAWNEAFVKAWPTNPPVRTTVVAVFMLDTVLVEVNAVATVQPFVGFP